MTDKPARLSDDELAAMDGAFVTATELRALLAEVRAGRELRRSLAYALAKPDRVMAIRLVKEFIADEENDHG